MVLNDTFTPPLALRASFPSFVVTTITPLAALAPQIDAAAASFSTVMLSTLFGFRVLIDASTGNPSTISSGSLLDATRVLSPRIWNDMSPLTSVVADSPATDPTSRSPILAVGCARCSASTFPNAPVARSRDIV